MSKVKMVSVLAVLVLVGTCLISPTYARDGRRYRNNSAAVIGGTAAAGAIIGGLVGGGKGAVIGALAGVAGGALINEASRDRGYYGYGYHGTQYPYAYGNGGY